MVAILLTLAMLITALGLALRRLRQRSRVGRGAGEPEAQPLPSAPRPELMRRRAELVRLAAEIDRERVAGRLGEAEHSRRRDEIKRELVRVIARLKQLEG